MINMLFIEVISQKVHDSHMHMISQLEKYMVETDTSVLLGLKRYTWLEYITSKDDGFCFVCYGECGKS
jgi:hypothetical protein